MIKQLLNILTRSFKENCIFGDGIHAIDPRTIDGQFKAVTRSTAGTTTITEPVSTDDSILLTDLLFTTDKVNGATATLRFTDGTNTINIIAAAVTDAPCNIGISFVGHWHGWAGARLELVTVGTVTATVACGYIKIDKQNTDQSYTEWNAKR